MKVVAIAPDDSLTNCLVEQTAQSTLVRSATSMATKGSQSRSESQVTGRKTRSPSRAGAESAYRRSTVSPVGSAEPTESSEHPTQFQGRQRAPLAQQKTSSREPSPEAADRQSTYVTAGQSTPDSLPVVPNPRLQALLTFGMRKEGNTWM